MDLVGRQEAPIEGGVMLGFCIFFVLVPKVVSRFLDTPQWRFPVKIWILEFYNYCFFSSILERLLFPRRYTQ